MIVNPRNGSFGDDGQAGITVPTCQTQAATSVVGPTAGQMRLGRIFPSRNYLITKASFNLITPAGSDDAFAICVYDQNGNRVATTGALTGVLATAAGVKVVTFPSPFVLSAYVNYYAGFHYNTIGTTVAALAHINLAAMQAYLYGPTPPQCEADISTQVFPPPATITFSGAAPATIAPPLITLRES